MKKVFAAACALASIASASSATAAELVTNGGFETGNFSGWTATGNIAVAGVPAFGVGGAAQGNFIAVFNSGDRAPNGVLSQSIVTVAGTNYNLAFDHGVTFDRPQQFTVSVIDNTTQAIIASQVVVSNTAAIQRATLNFTGLSNSSLIRFSDFSGNQSNSQDWNLDNVSATSAVPEPSTWAMMLIGFGAVGASMRRRKTTARIQFA